MAQRKQTLAAIAGGQAVKVRAKAVSAPKLAPVLVPEDADHFIMRDGVTFAGHHLIIDLWEAEGLDDKERIEAAMRDAVEAAGATLLHIHLHTFEPNGGVSGVAVLAESHISVQHFQCGGSKSDLPVSWRRFRNFQRRRLFTTARAQRNGRNHC